MMMIPPMTEGRHESAAPSESGGLVRKSDPKFPTVYTYDFFKMVVVVASEGEPEKSRSFRPPQSLVDWESEKKTIVVPVDGKHDEE